MAECFLEKDILLTYQEYRTCVEAAMAYADAHKNYQFSAYKRSKAFTIFRLPAGWKNGVWFPKTKHPPSTLVIHHPKLRYALENMILPIRDS
ncbi:MAG: hypothetical protein ACLU9T_02220 [Blautia faecis]